MRVLTLLSNTSRYTSQEHNATLAFMYGPLVLAGVHMDTDVWVPKGGTKGAKADPASFITRNSTANSSVLDFEAVRQSINSC